MFFVRIGQAIAWLLLILGGLRTAMGLFVAGIDDQASRSAAAARYLGSATSGDAIEQGITWFLFGLVLGLLAQIARKLSQQST